MFNRSLLLCLPLLIAAPAISAGHGVYYQQYEKAAPAPAAPKAKSYWRSALLGAATAAMAIVAVNNTDKFKAGAAFGSLVLAYCGAAYTVLCCEKIDTPKDGLASLATYGYTLMGTLLAGPALFAAAKDASPAALELAKQGYAYLDLPGFINQFKCH